MKKNIGVAGAIIAFIALAILYCANSLEKGNNKYVLFNNGLYLDKNIVFYENELKLNASKLGKEIGITSSKQQVFEIKGLSSDEWICLRNNGKEYVYRNADVKIIDRLDDFEINRLELFDETGKEVIFQTDSKTVLEEIENSVQDSNIVTGELIANEQNIMSLYSDKFEGLSYNLYFIRDKNNEQYLYDEAMDVVWKLKKNIIDKEN